MCVCVFICVHVCTLGVGVNTLGYVFRHVLVRKISWDERMVGGRDSTDRKGERDVSEAARH